MKKYMIIDGNSIINRAFYAIKNLTNSAGLPTNGIYGFLNILFKNIEEYSPDYISVAFDMRAPTFRHKHYKQYKAHRKGMPDELALQMPVLKEILSAMNISIYEKEGYEADDIIGTVSRICDESGVECLILTGDKDDLQLASENTKVLLTTTRMGATTTEVYDDKAVKEKYGVTPHEFIAVKALMGDASDNIPGVAGIGEKSAFALISEFGSIENLYDNLDSPSIKTAARNKLASGREEANLSYYLATIDRFVPDDYDISKDNVKEYDNRRLSELFTNLELKSFLKKVGGSSNESLTLPENNVLIDIDEVNEYLGKIGDTFYYRVYKAAYELYCLAFLSDGKCHTITPGFGVYPQDIADAIKPIMADDKIKKISADIKADMVFLDEYGVKINNYYDIGVGAYLLDSSRSDYSLCALTDAFLSAEIADAEEILGKGKSRKSMDCLDSDSFEKIVCGEVGSLPHLYKYEREKIDELGQRELCDNIEMPLVEVLASMELEGFLVDSDKLDEYGKMLGNRIEELEKEIYDLAGEEFNIGSPKQLGVILFEKLGLKAVKKTKTGYSTNAEVLEKLLGKHPVIEKIIEYRQITKLKSTYADGLYWLIDATDGRIHSTFKQTVTMTGRISSTEPNLQNIPVRLELGRELRKMFVAREGYVLIDADYSQIELRVLAALANDKAMIDAFNSGEDIHAATAKNVFGVDEVTPLLRSRAKAVNFGIVYGMGSFSLSGDLGISVGEAKEYIDSYFAKHPNVKKFMDDAVAQAKEQGWVETAFKRRRYIPEVTSSNFALRSAGERMAMNTPIQGSAADIIKIAMVSVYNALKKLEKSKLILQVHDELIIEAHESEAEMAKKILTECMENAVNLAVPMVAEANIGKSWFDAK
ncbi:MAG: DNA polymerase I [Clostridia bacterium]|nr:DNA polymerase I [Clostridia bacterium]